MQELSRKAGGFVENLFSEHINGMDYNTFRNIINNMYDELLIYDKNYYIVYINNACSRHYGCTPQEMIGKNFYDFVNDDWWNPSILPIVNQKKKAYAIKQKTLMGTELLTIAAPIFDREGQIQFVVMNVRDTVSEADLYNPYYHTESNSPEKNIRIIAESKEMKLILQTANKIAKLNVPCILSGETGVGKSAIARYIHDYSQRKDSPFLVVDCDSTPNEQMLSDLRLLEKNDGYFSNAKDGTLVFLNIEKLSSTSQSQLLQILKILEKKDLSFRFMATTSKNLEEMSNVGYFKKDLYYALYIVNLYIPPLRKRREDIQPLIYMFLTNFCKAYNCTRQITDTAMQILINAPWDNNVSELRFMIERLVVMSENLEIDVEQLPSQLFGISDNNINILEYDVEKTFNERVAQYEALLVKEAYNKCKSSRKVANYLNISQTKANNLIRKYISIKND